MAGILSTEPLAHLVTAADQAYFIVTDVLICCTVYKYSNIPEPPSAKKRDGRILAIVLLTRELMTRSALQSRKWQLIGMS